jgi:murein DD-endopeptidase MepM/ murein hydrolase activator NlpD
VTATLSGELAEARIVDFPLRGEWVAVHTPASKIPSHGTDMLGQRFAFDLIRFDARKGSRYYPVGTARMLFLGVRTQDCHGWGEPIHAPLDGEVVVARDGLAERARIHPLREVALVLWTGLTFRPSETALHRVMGNHVIMRGGGVYAAFAHLTTGSVAVKAGQVVRAGDVLGRVGHTGNSTAPHLHFQLMDAVDPLTARGVPCAFRAYEVERGNAWVRVENMIPRSDERIRSVADPGQPETVANGT